MCEINQRDLSLSKGLVDCPFSTPNKWSISAASRGDTALEDPCPNFGELSWLERFLIS